MVAEAQFYCQNLDVPIQLQLACESAWCGIRPHDTLGQDKQQGIAQCATGTNKVPTQRRKYGSMAAELAKVEGDYAELERSAEMCRI